MPRQQIKRKATRRQISEFFKTINDNVKRTIFFLININENLKYLIIKKKFLYYKNTHHLIVRPFSIKYWSET